MPTLLFQKYCQIVEEEMVGTTSNFLNKGELDKDLNQTFIVLIPRTQSSDCIAQFKPISLCKAIYKIISKTLSN